MQIVFLIVIAAVISCLTVYGTQRLLVNNRNARRNLILTACGFLVNLIATVAADCIIQAGRPSFYYHTHRLGTTTIRIFAISCVGCSFLFALVLMILERKLQKPSFLRHIVLSFLIAVSVSELLEIFYFNFRHFELIGADAFEIVYTPDRLYAHGMYFNRASWKFHPYNNPLEPAIETFIGYKKVRNITYAFDDGSPRTVVRLNFNDQAHRNYFSIPDRAFIQGIPRSFSIPLHTVGVTYSILLTLPEIIAPDASYGISLDSVVVNSVVPLDIRPMRFVLCFLLIFVIAMFFPGSPIWKIPLKLNNVSQTVSVIILLLFFCTSFCWTVFSSYTGSDQSMTEQKAELNENYQQYDKLVEALMVPRYALLEKPHHYLEKDGDPYDMQLREKRQYSYLWDTAYYKGQYFVYFGVVPAVMVLLPYRLITGTMQPLDYAILGYAVFFLFGLYGVYSQIVKHYFQHISFGLYWTGLFLLLTSLNITWCLRRTLVYELAIVSGVCLAIWGIFFVLLAKFHERLKYLCGFISGACTALAVGCRPTMIFISLIVFLLAWSVLSQDGKRFTKRNLFFFFSFFLPYIAVGLALMKYNYERFDNPFEFGITYQLTTENRSTGLPLLGPYGIILSMMSSWFTFPMLDMDFPFIHLQTPNLPYNGMILDTGMVLGVFSYPVMAFLFVFPLLRSRFQSHGKGLRIFCVSCLVSAVMITFTSANFAIVNRYETDYLFLLALTAVFTMFCVYEKFQERGMEKSLQGFILFSMIIGVGLFAVLSVTGEDNWFSNINPLYYDKLRYSLSPWL